MYRHSISFSESEDEFSERRRPRDIETKLIGNAVEPLSWKVISLFAFLPLGVDSAAIVVGFFYTTFLLEVAKLPPSFSGFVFIAGQVVDAVTAPAIGKLTDNTVTRWGRRRPWIFLAAIPFSVIYVLLWTTWVSDYGQGAMFAYYSVMFMLYNLIANCIIVPAQSLTPDLVNTYNEATKLTEWRVIVYTLFGIIAVTGHSYLIEAFNVKPLTNITSTFQEEEHDYSKGYAVSSYILSAVFLCFAMFPTIFLRERERTAEQVALGRREGLLENLKDLAMVFKSRNFLCVAAMYFLCWTSVQMVQNNLFLYNKYVVQKEDWFMFIVMVVLACTAPASFLWGKMTLCLGKKKTYLYGASQWVLVTLVLYFLDRTVPLWIVFVISGAAGLCIGVAFLLPWTMLPDIIDENEMVTGSRREGAFYSIFIFLQKMGAATALGVSNWSLGAAGYDAGEPGTPPPLSQPESVLTTLRITVGPLGSVLVFLSIIPMLFYNLDKDKMHQIKQILLEKERGEDYRQKSDGDDVVALEESM